LAAHRDFLQFLSLFFTPGGGHYENAVIYIYKSHSLTATYA
jgi:hypothetical protein